MHIQRSLDSSASRGNYHSHPGGLNMKQTDWYAGWQKPVKDRPGVYKRRFEETRSQSRKCYWDGVNFSVALDFFVVSLLKSGRIPRHLISNYQDLEWCGVLHIEDTSEK